MTANHSCYDSTSSHLTSITDANTHVAVAMTYDAQGRVATQKDARGLTTGQQTTFAYDTPSAGTTTVTYPATSFDGFAPQQIDTYDSQQQLSQEVWKPSSSETLTTSYGYDGNGFRNRVTDPRTNTTLSCYDTAYDGTAISGSRGNLTRLISPPPASGQNPLVTLFQYDAKNNLTETVAPKGVSNGSTVTCSTDLSASINTSDATDLAYDASGVQLLSVTRRFTDPDLGLQTATTKFEYGDAANPGQVTKVIPPRGNTGANPDYTYATSFTYNASGSQAGLLQSVTDPLGNQTTFSYDAVGRRTSLVDPLGHASGGVPADHTWSFSFDNEDRLTSASAPAPMAGGAALVTSASFDPVGNRLRVTDANGTITRFTYDERDSLRTVVQSATQADPNGDPNAITTTYSYDDLGNLVRVDRATGDAANERVVDYALYVPGVTARAVDVVARSGQTGVRRVA